MLTGLPARDQAHSNVRERTMQSEINEALARLLEASGQYKVLRRIMPATPGFRPEIGAKIGIVLDVETTGLDTVRDEVIELAMIKFAYSADDRILGVVDVFQALREPSFPITPEITALTRITNEMVADREIEPLAVDRFTADANIIVAHNSAFDRKFAERFWPAFVHKPWACSFSGVTWKEHGFASGKLEHLLAACGLFYDAHRAADDCHALLALMDPRSGGRRSSPPTQRRELVPSSVIPLGRTPATPRGHHRTEQARLAQTCSTTPSEARRVSEPRAYLTDQDQTGRKRIVV